MNNKLLAFNNFFGLICATLVFVMLACTNKSQQKSEADQSKTSDNSRVNLSDTAEWRSTSKDSFPISKW